MSIGVVGSSAGLTFEHACGYTSLARLKSAQTDTIVGIASMTKLITTIAALQLYEKGKIDLDDMGSKYIPSFEKLQILKSFQNKVPQFVAPARAPTIRELMTHTSGFVYSMWNENALFAEKLGITGGLRSGKKMYLNAPLAFEPGSNWEYGVGIDWLGVIVEAVSGMSLPEYFETNIFSRLTMKDTFFEIPQEKIDRVAHLLFRKETSRLLKFLFVLSPGELVEVPLFSKPRTSREREKNEYSGGGGLYSTLPDYAKLLQSLLAGGELEGIRLLRQKSVDMMFSNQIADFKDIGKAKSKISIYTNDIDLAFNSFAQFGLGMLLHPKGTLDGRLDGSGSWGGLFNTYFWIDRKVDCFGIFATQVLPFFDTQSVATLCDFEKAIYEKVHI